MTKKTIKDVTFDFEADDGLGPHIAYTVQANGGAASGKNVPLLLKSEDAPATEDIFKQLEQVTVTLSFEEFLRKFFDMYYGEAELLAKVLGFKTEDEQWLEDCENDKPYVSWVDEKVANITLLKSAYEDKEELTVEKMIEILPLRKHFETNLNKTVETTPKPESDINVNKGNIVDPKDKKTETGTVEVAELLKSAEAKELLKSLVDDAVTKATADANATIKKQAASIVALQEKEDARIMKGFETLTKSFTALEEDVQKSLQEVLFKNVTTEGMDVVVDALKTMQESVEKAKEAFAEEEEGQDVEAPVVDQTTITKSSLADRIAEMTSNGQL